MNFHKRVLIGSIFHIFDFTIGFFDILPDFIGFLVIASAFSVHSTREANKGLILSLILVMTSLIQLMIPIPNMGLTMPPFDGYLGVLMIIAGALTILHFGYIFIVSNQILSDQDAKFPKVFMIVQLVNFALLGLVVHVTSSVALTISLLSIGLSVLSMIYFFIALIQRKNLENQLKLTDFTELGHSTV